MNVIAKLTLGEDLILLFVDAELVVYSLFLVSREVFFQIRTSEGELHQVLLCVYVREINKFIGLFNDELIV